MERDVLIAYGASQLVRERFFYSSDAYVVSVCDDCGLICIAKDNTYYCKNCKNSTRVCTDIYCIFYRFQRWRFHMLANYYSKN